MDHTPLQQQVVVIVAEALDADPAAVQLHSSLIDDLGAESIDFIDLAFRIETAFAIEVPHEELWKGGVSTAGASPAEIAAAMRERMPAFNWERFPAKPTAGDLPRLITVQTIVSYLEHRGIGAPEAGG